MNFNWDTSSVVPDTDFSRFPVYRDADLIHVLVVVLVIGSIHDDLIEDLIETGHVGYLAVFHGFRARIEHPHVAHRALNRPNIGIRALGDMFQLGELSRVVSTSCADRKISFLYQPSGTFQKHLAPSMVSTHQSRRPRRIHWRHLPMASRQLS